MGHSAYPKYEGIEFIRFSLKIRDHNERPEIEQEFRERYPGLTAMMEVCWDRDMNKRPSFCEIFKKLSLLSENDINKYEEQFPFFKNNEKILSNDLFYGYKKVDTQILHSYVETIFNSLKPSNTTEIDGKFYMTKEIFKKIFVIYSDYKITEKNISGEYGDFLKNLCVFFPTDVDIILSDISIGSYKFIIECFVFESFNNNLDQIFKNDDLFTKECYLKTVSYYAFFASVSTSLKILKEQEFTFTFLLPVLNRITKTKTIYSNIAYLCFIDLIYMAIEKDAVVDFDIIIKEMTDFFISNNFGTLEHSNKLLKSITNKYIKITENLDDEAISVINLYSTILDKNPNIISEETACSVIELVKSFIYKFEGNCLTLLLNFSKFIKEESSKSFLKENFIAHFIDTIINNNYNKSHPLLDLSQIKKIDETTILQDQDFSDLIEDEMKPIVSIFKEIITLDIEFSFYFLSETVNKIRDLKNRKNVIYGNCPIIFHLILCAIKKIQNITVYNEIKYPLFYNFMFGPNYLSKIIWHLSQMNFKFSNNNNIEHIPIDEKFSTICKDIFSLNPQIKIENDKNFNILEYTPIKEFEDICPENIDFLNNLMLFFPDSSTFNSILESIPKYSLNEFNDYFLFQIINKNLEEIERNAKLIENELGFKIYSFYVFFTWISFYLQIQINQEKLDIVPLLKILNIVKNTTKYSKYNDISVSCFVDLIKLAVKNDMIDNYITIIDEVRIFLKDSLSLSSFSDEIIQTLTMKIFDLKNGFNEQSDSLLDLVTSIYNQNQKSIKPNTIQAIIDQIKDCIINCRENYLSFFVLTAKFIEENRFLVIFEKIISHILDECIHVDCNDNYDKPLYIDNMNDFFHARNIDLYQLDKTQLQNPLDIFKVKSLESLLNQNDFQLKQAIRLIKKVIVTKAESLETILFKLINIMLRVFENCNSILNQQSIFIFYLIDQKFKVISKYLFNECDKELFENKLLIKIFDVNNTYFTPKLNNEIIISFRHFTIQYLIGNNLIIFKKILEHYMFYPHLFLECLCHIHLIIKNENKNIDLSPIADILMKSLIDYRINSNTSDLSNDDILFLKIRKLALSLLNYFKDRTSIFMSNDFIKHYFILLTEPPICKEIINLIFDFLKSITYNEYDQLKEKNIDFCLSCTFSDFVKVCFDDMPEKEGISLISTFLKLLDENAKLNTIVAKIFAQIIIKCIKYLITIDIKSKELENIDDLVIYLIDFIFLIYQTNDNFFDSSLLVFLVVHFMPKLKHKQRINDKLLMIITNDEKLIKNPKFLCSYVSIFLKTDQICNIVNSIYNLCLYSKENCFKCHEGHLDLFIIEKINEWRKGINSNENNFVKEEKVLDAFIHLFFKISSIISTVPIMNQYFSLLSPIDSKCQKIIRITNGILKESLKELLVSISPLPNDINIECIDKSHFENGFCFVFWIYFSSLTNGELQNVFELNDGAGNVFKVNIDLFNVQLKKTHSSEKFDDINFKMNNIPLNKWIMISICSTNNQENNTSNAIFYIDYINVIYDFDYKPENQVKCTINSGNDNSNSYLLGLFMLLKPLSNNEITNLYERGQKSPLILTDKTIFAYQPQYNDDVIDFKEIYKVDNIHKKQTLICPSNYCYSFFDMIQFHFDFNNIILLFEKSNSLQNNELIIEMLTNLLNQGEEFQKSFCSFNCFYKISHLLKNLDQSTRTFRLYELYFKLLQIIVYENLQKQLIDAILMNIELWPMDNPENKMKIFENWSTVLYDKYLDLIHSIRPIEWFLFKIQDCFDPNNLNDQCHINCRKSLQSIVIKLFRYEMSINHILLIIYFISKKSTLIEKKDMISFLIEIYKENNLIEGDCDLSKIIQPLISIFETKGNDEDIISEIIYLINSIYESKKYQINNFDKIIKNIFFILNSNEYLFSLEKFESLVNNKTTIIETASDYYINETSTFDWVSLICKTEYDKNLIKETVFLFRFHLKELIYAINVIRFSENSIEKLDQFQYDILFTILKSNSYLEQKELFTFIVQFIFFRLEKTQTFLYNPFVKSEFNNNEIEEIMKDSSIKYKFGLRIKFENDVLEWLDLDLAINAIILIIIKLKDNQYSNSIIKLKDDQYSIINSMNILLYFINKIKPEGLNIYNKNQNKNKFVKKMKILNNKDNNFFMPFDSLNESRLALADSVQSYMANISIVINTLNDNYQELKDNYDLFKQKLNLFNKQMTNTIEKEYLISFNSFIIDDSIFKSININNRGIKFRRDNIFCIDYCPFKVFKHFSFDKECKETENLFTISTKLESNQQITLINVKSNQKIVIKSDEIDYVLCSDKKERKGFQILTKSGKNYNFILSEESSQYFDLIWNKFDSMEYIDKTKIMKTDKQIKLKLKEITSLWTDNKISNFDYLMILNILSGRNFNDFDRYPVFPWILTDYTSNILDLNDPKSYRDLSKPVGTFSKKRLQKIKNRLDDCYYSTGYSNCYSVLNWLRRLEPFSTKSQNQELYSKFESISDSFIDVSNNDNDFRELIPEFFFLPEFLMSFNGDNVVLPPWSNNSPIEFIYKHRKALESKFVSSNINNWIDLIWGYKQDGIESYNANNVFAPEMNEFGQIPIKLFEKKHPERKMFVSPSSLFSSFSINFTNISPPVIFYVSLEKKVTGREKVTILAFKIVDSKGNFFTHNFDLSSNVYEKNEVELKSINNIKIDNNKPIFINSNIIGFIENNKKHVNFFNCEKGSTEQIRFQNYEIELIESDQQGHLIIYSADSSVVLFNMNLSDFSKPNTDTSSLVKRISSEKTNFLPKLHIKDSPSLKKLSSSTSNLLSPSENSFPSTSLSDDVQNPSSDLNTSKYSNSFYTFKYKIVCVGIS